MRENGARVKSADRVMAVLDLIGDQGSLSFAEIVAGLERFRRGHADPADERAVLAVEIDHRCAHATDDQPRMLP